MKFGNELAIIKRFLRDPDGDIWSEMDIHTFWNDSQQELFSKAGYIERAHSYKYPPEYTWAYMYEWEKQHTDGEAYQCLTTWQARNMVICYPWEAGYWLTNSDTPDDGTRFTHPWESVYASPADIVPCPLHTQFHKMKFIAYDEEPLEPIDRKQLSLEDRFYRTSEGTPVNYWRPDKEGNRFVIYPRPTSVTWDDTELIRSPLESFDDAGTILTWDEGHLDEADKGIITDTIAVDGQIFMVFEALPEEVPEDPGAWYKDDLDMPDYLSKYVRYATLERAFGADTDGFIPSLRDYWRMRKEIGLRAIKKFKSLRKTDRDYCFGGPITKTRSRHPRLPSTYPEVWP